VGDPEDCAILPTSVDTETPAHLARLDFKEEAPDEFNVVPLWGEETGASFAPTIE